MSANIIDGRKDVKINREDLDELLW